MQVTIEVLLKGRFKWWKRHQINNWFRWLTNNVGIVGTVFDYKTTKVTKTGDLILMFICTQDKDITSLRHYLKRDFGDSIYKMLVTIKPDGGLHEALKKEEG